MGITGTSPGGHSGRLSLLVRTVSLFFLCGILLSWPLWLSGRVFPLTPVVPLPDLPRTISIVIASLLCASLVLLFIFPLSRKAAILVLAVLAAEAFTDQNRWQPWVFQYLLFILLLAVRGREKKYQVTDEKITQGFRLVVCGIYFWSGMQKLNPDYFTDMTVWLTEPIGRYFGAGAGTFAARAACAIPAVEIFIAFGLMARATRRFALIITIGMHVYIALLTTPLGRDVNYVILPWNLCMITLVLLLFRRQDAASPRNVFSAARERYLLPVFVLAWIAPLLSFFGVYDSYLSASLYSGNSDNGFIYLSKNACHELPQEWRSKVYTQVPQTRPDTLYYIYVNECSMQELHVPAYPEERIFRQVKNRLETLLPDSEALTLVIQRKFTWTRKGYYETAE
jgi:hypothetical protein